NTTLRDALDMLSKKFDVSIRIDPGSFIRRGVVEPNEDPFKFYDSQVRLPIVRAMSLGEVLTDLLAQVNPKGRVTYVAKASHIAIVPAFIAPFPGQIGIERMPEGAAPVLNPDLIDEQFVGDPVSVDYENKPLIEILRELADQTGANITLDNRQRDKG